MLGLPNFSNPGGAILLFEEQSHNQVLFLAPPKVNEANINLPPKNSEKLLYNKDLARYALSVKEIAQKEGVPCLNIYDFFDESTMLDSDGIHPNDCAMKKYTNTLNNYLYNQES